MSKIKLQITMEEELLNDLDNYCDKNYMNRSFAISQAVIQVLNGQKIIDSIFNLSKAVRMAAEKGEMDEETKREIESFETLVKMYTKK